MLVRAAAEVSLCNVDDCLERLGEGREGSETGHAEIGQHRDVHTDTRAPFFFMVSKLWTALL